MRTRFGEPSLRSERKDRVKSFYPVRGNQGRRAKYGDCAFQVLGEYVQAHFRADVGQSSCSEVVSAHQLLVVPKTCSMRLRLSRFASGLSSGRRFMASITSLVRSG